MITTERIIHNYTLWQNDEKTSRTALDGVSLNIRQGDFVVILGPNGSGKSTLAKHLNVLLLPDEGIVWIDGKDTKDEANLWKIRDIVGMVFQNPDNQIIGTSVEEDVAFGPENRNIPSDIIRKNVADSLRAVGLFSKRKVSPSKLSGGQKQRVAVAGVLASDCQCIVLDEPTAMLDPQSRKDLLATVRKLHQTGSTIILITHHMEEAVDADQIILMNHGKVVGTGTPTEIFSDPELVRSVNMDLPKVAELAYELAEHGLLQKQPILRAEEFLDEVMTSYREGIRPYGKWMAEDMLKRTAEDAAKPILLEADNVFFSYGKNGRHAVPVLNGASFQVHEGEFLGLIGSSGAGKTTLIKHLNGLIKADRGDIRFRGESIYHKKYRLSNLRKRVGLVFQYPEHQLFCKTVLDDVCFGPKNMGMSEEAARQAAIESLELVGIGEEYYSMSPLDLSGGQMRRVAIAGVLAMQPEVLIMDEPAAGLDPETKNAVFGLIERIRRERGLAVVLVSHDMEDIADYTDRVLVLHEGRIEMDDVPAAVFSDTEQVRALGIDVPVVTDLCERLAAAGLPLSGQAVDVAGAAGIICRAFEERGGQDA